MVQYLSTEAQEQKDNLLIELDKIIGEPSRAEDIASWVQDCRSLELELDIDRVARFAVYRNSLAVLAHLVENEGASLTRPDILGRSEIFYAMRRFPDSQMLMYVASKIQQGSTLMGLDRQDNENLQTPLHYAVALDSLDAVELLLANGANTEIKCKEGRKPRELVDRIIPFDPIHLGWCVTLLFESKTLLQDRTWIYEKNPALLRPRQMLGQLQDDLKLIATKPKERNNTPIWLHVPWTNGVVVFSVLRRYGRDAGDPTYAIDEFSRILRGSITVPPNYDLPYCDPFYKPTENLAEYPQVSAILPCLVLRLRDSQTQARSSIQDLKKDMMDDFASTTVLPERTLDETYFPSLSEDALRIRNDAQVVSRAFAKASSGISTGKDTAPILMVSQLWLWMRGNRIFTASPADSPGTLTEEECRSLEFLVPDWQFIEPYVLFGLIIAHYVSEFSRSSGTKEFGSPFDIFESSVVRVLADVDSYVTSRPSARPEMETERELMFRIADIREELVMIQQVLAQQLEIIEKLIYDIEENNHKLDMENNERSMTGEVPSNISKQRFIQVKRSIADIKKYQKRAEKIDSDAERVEKRVQDQLNLRRTHVSIEDARAGLILSRAGLVTSTAVIGFTVITIIFAPLAFVTALFALPIDILLRNQVQFNTAGSNSASEDGVGFMGAYTTRYVATWFVVAEIVSLVVTGLLVVICLWLLGSTKSFVALQESTTRQTEAARVYAPSDIGEAKGTASTANTSASELGREQAGLRKRVANIFDRKSKGVLTSKV